MAFTPLGDALHRKFSAATPLKKQVEASLVIEYATAVLRDLLGESLAIHAKPLFLKNRTLTITCSSSSVAQEIRLNQANIVETINNKLGKKEVDRIRYLA
ncbi:MAG: DUF721 domain-containing protein [Candidatus Magasanikbacteria bacterium]|nr:DUF721 domain-containing protein [Candidatus Magasanikbacteria bacterium]